MTDSKVTPIFGGPAPGEVDPVLIEKAEQFLARVRAGEVRALAIIWVRPNGWPSQSIKHDPDTVNALHSGVVCAAGFLTDCLNACSVEATPPPVSDAG